MVRLPIVEPPRRSGLPAIVLTARRGFLDLVFEPHRRAPFVEHAKIAEAVGPAHAWPGEFLPAGENGLAGAVDLEGIEVARFVHADGLALSVGMDQVDPAGADVAVAAGEPEVRHLDAALGAEDAQHIVLGERNAA